MWRQIKGAYGIDRFCVAPAIQEMAGVGAIDHYDSMAEALATTTGVKVFLEPGGTDSLADIPDGDVVLIFGNTETGNSGLIQPGDLSVQIPSANPVDLYGINAAAIVLAYLHGL